MYYVYIIQNSEGILYKGHTDDLERRIGEHNSKKKNTYTNSRGPWVLVHREEFLKRGEAMKREKFFKSGKGRVILRDILYNK